MYLGKPAEWLASGQRVPERSVRCRPLALTTSAIRAIVTTYLSRTTEPEDLAATIRHGSEKFHASRDDTIESRRRIVGEKQHCFGAMPLQSRELR
jgi:hypothetical protein